MFESSLDWLFDWYCWCCFCSVDTTAALFPLLSIYLSIYRLFLFLFLFLFVLDQQIYVMSALTGVVLNLFVLLFAFFLLCTVFVFFHYPYGSTWAASIRTSRSSHKLCLFWYAPTTTPVGKELFFVVAGVYFPFQTHISNLLTPSKFGFYQQVRKYGRIRSPRTASQSIC